MSPAVRHLVIPVYLAACLLLGGASAAGLLANLLLQLAALPIIGWAFWELDGQRLTPPSRLLLLMAALLVTITLLQLVPLPPSVWALLPGRGPVASGFRLLGVPLPWLPLSLAPTATIASALWLLPAFAVVLGITVLGAFRNRWLSWALLLVMALSVGLGTFQLAGGKAGGAYFYRYSNWGQAVGFFANSNHLATLLVICIPFLFALRQSLLKDARTRQRASAVHVLVWAALAVIAVGLLINTSLAGVALGVPVALLSILAFRSKPMPRWPLLVGAVTLLSVAGIGLILMGSVENNLIGQQTEHQELSRQTSFARTLNAAGEYLPIGSGIGSFQPIYRTQEPLKDVTTTYMNHAHSDWLELLLETGLVGALLAVAFLAWWGRRIGAIWRAERPDLYGRAATIATGAMLLHSIVDYPLRTAALSAVFGMCVALMADVRPFVRRARGPSKARELTL